MEAVLERDDQEVLRTHNNSEVLLQDVVGTVSFFCAIAIAPTYTDVWRWMYAPARSYKVSEVMDALDTLVEAGILVAEDGRVRVPWERKMIEGMHAAYRDADYKYRQARRLSYWVACVPGVRALAVCNTLAWEATNKEGDSDLFVIARPGFLWLVRLLCVLPLILLRLRPGQRAHHTIDFTFFCSDQALDLKPLKRGEEDPYLAYWIRSLVPVLNDGALETLQKENAWARDLLPNTVPRSLAWYRRPNTRVVRKLFGMSNALAGFLETTRLRAPLEFLAKTVSCWRLPEAIRTRMNQDTSVVVNDQMLKFHTTDRRQEITRAKQYTTQKLMDRYRAL